MTDIAETAPAKARAGQPLVDLDRVWLRYGGPTGTLALKECSFKVAEGEFVAVVGPSGCGKSTLMKAVTGLWPINKGSVIVAGHEVSGPLNFVGMAFQNSSLLPWRKTLPNIMLPLEIVEPHRSRLAANRKEYEGRALSLLDAVGLKDFAQKYPWQLSGGMQQRASLCRALVHEPSLLMLDEPFGALDAFTKEELWEVMQTLWLRTNPTVIMVTHDLREAIFLADRIVVMSNRPGRIIAERRSPFKRPRTLEDTFTAEFTDLFHELRDYISQARAEEPGAA